MKSLGVIALAALVVLAGVGYFLYQQSQAREAEQAQARAAREERVRGISDYSKACSDLAAAASVLKKESRFYLDNLTNPKVTGKNVTDALEKFVKPLVTVQAISGTPSSFGLTPDECPAPSRKDSSFEANLEASVARAECEVKVCTKMRDQLSRVAP